MLQVSLINLCFKVGMDNGQTIVVVVLLLYDHGIQLQCMVMSGWSVNLATLFLGRLRPLNLSGELTTV